MMRPSNHLDIVWLCRDAVDFRKGINGLSILVEEQLVRDPFSGQLFVFVNHKRDKIKILYWECAGFCMWQKRLERERFKSLRGGLLQARADGEPDQTAQGPACLGPHLVSQRDS